MRPRSSGPPGDGVSVEETALRLADLKAAAVARREPEALVIGADQILVCDGVWFDKPPDLAAARGAASRAARTHPCTGDRGRVPAGRTAPLAPRRPAAPRDARFSDAFLDAYLAAEGEEVTATVGAYRLEGRGVQLFDASRANMPPF